MAATASGSSKKRKSYTNPADEPRLKDPLVSRLSSVAVVTSSFLQAKDLFLPPSHSLRLESLLSSLPTAPSPTPSAATWFHRFVTSAVEEDDPRWFLCFRMSRSTFFHLLSILSSSDLPLASFAAAIFRLAHAASYKSLLLRFGFSSTADASRAFFTVCKLVNDKLGLLDDPKPDYSPRLLPNCCGVLGFGRFEVNGKLLGKNGSLLVQALVDSKGRFVDISAGWPSTMDQEAIFRQTKLSTRSFLNGAPCILGNGVSVPRYILGDSCLPLLPWLLIPFDEDEDEDSLESPCTEFNNVIYTALHTVDIAFAKVRARWRILDNRWKPETMEFIPFVLTTACLLHNFLVNSGDALQDKWVNDAAAAAKARKNEQDKEETRRSQGESYIESRRIRDAIALNLSRMSSLR